MEKSRMLRSVSSGENSWDTVRERVLDTVQRTLTPMALKYDYSRVPLEENIKWRPMVLVLGNYSSGKSTLINELLGQDVQRTGQAPTDDAFTVITYQGDAEAGAEERDGRVLLQDDQYPFSVLRRHGQKFASHFRLKLVPSPFLESLAIIDTPGMLDSVTEFDRGYDYQQVVGDLASIADLILVLFDPHKAGTVRETYESLKKTLPLATYEDRLVFVLNRVDECESLEDMLRVYGTLCWNLSQMTGRKDIPLIKLTYSQALSGGGEHEYLKFLQNQREELRKEILLAPRHRLDHLATYVEEHGTRLTHMLEGLLAYVKATRSFLFRCWAAGGALSLLLGVLTYWLLADPSFSDYVSPAFLPSIGSVVIVATFALWCILIRAIVMPWYHRHQLPFLDQLTVLDTPARLDSWRTVRPVLERYLIRKKGRLWLHSVKNDYRRVKQAWEQASRDIREALTS